MSNEAGLIAFVCFKLIGNILFSVVVWVGVTVILERFLQGISACVALCLLASNQGSLPLSIFFPELQ